MKYYCNAILFKQHFTTKNCSALVIIVFLKCLFKFTKESLG